MCLDCEIVFIVCIINVFIVSVYTRKFLQTDTCFSACEHIVSHGIAKGNTVQREVVCVSLGCSSKTERERESERKRMTDFFSLVKITRWDAFEVPTDGLIQFQNRFSVVFFLGLETCIQLVTG